MTPRFISPTGGPTLGPVPGSEFRNNRGDHLHGGVDLNLACGKPILAPQKGQVIYVGGSFTGGNKCTISHRRLLWKNRHTTNHYHFGRKHTPPTDSIIVRVGDTVKKGQTLGWCGDSGNANACHDHFEHFVDGKRVDPLQYCDEYVVARAGKLFRRRLHLTYPKSLGPDVVYLQKRLDRHGFPCGFPDGDYGPLTMVAVKDFQKAKNLTVDGIIGKKTWDKLTERPTR